VPPWLIFLLLVALAIALIFQLASRRYGWRVLGYWLVVFIGVVGFEALAESAGWNVTRMGEVRLGPDVAGGVLAAGVLWLLRV
jgi:hypothetical protein